MPGSDTSSVKETREKEDVAIFQEIPVTREEILNCSYSKWYNRFKSNTLGKVKVLKPIPKSFIEYLESDDFRLPSDANEKDPFFRPVVPSSDNEYSDWSEDEDANTEARNTQPEKSTSIKKLPVYEKPDFREFHDQIRNTLKEFKKVSPKLNWSAPKDATWILPNKTMMCQTTSDVYLLLKSSDYISHDMYHAFDTAIDNKKETDDEKPEDDVEYELVLREWHDINPSMEFRCFVKDRELIAISQRDLNYYEFLADITDQLTDLIDRFFETTLLPNFDNNSFVFDVYVPKSLQKVYLIDVNPYARKTDPLLFTWNEIITMETDLDFPEFRLVTKYNSGRFGYKEHVQNHVPRDVVDATMDSSAMAQLAQEWSRLMTKESLQGEESSSDDEE
ncbi:hypothetical protein BVG19_g1888 [[Candida] boidinii]|nr:hypothetical protein BVG19_g1888 [[Candida] boidinii]OWB51428.1 hypothetical protein B5S27_g2989 [[Candida] boidinii]